MKVLQVSKFYPPVLGGIESVTWELTEGLNRAGVRTDVLCSNQVARTERTMQRGGYRVVRAASWGMWLSTSMAPAMARLLLPMQRDYDIVHVHMPDPMAALAVWLARPRGRVVLHWHSDVIRQRLAMRLYEPLQRWLLGRADAVIATSEPYADASPALAPWRAKVAVVPIGIGDKRDEVRPDQVAAIRQRFRGRRIVFALGRMTYYKGFDILTEAAAALPDDCAVVIGGDGELLQLHRSFAARRGVAGKVHFIGHVPDIELASHFDACDVFCMSSTVRAEAYGVAMLEAMVMGKPVVAADIPGSGVPWVNIDGCTGYNTPPYGAQPLALALARVLGDAVLRQRLGAAARQRYDQEFTAERMTKRVIDLYQAVASG